MGEEQYRRIWEYYAALSEGRAGYHLAARFEGFSIYERDGPPAAREEPPR